MNFRVSIKQTLARIRVAEKKKDLKVVINFKKELIPFLVALRQEGSIYKFKKKKKMMELCLKKIKTTLQLKKKKQVLRDFDISAILYKSPATLIFISTTFGVGTKSSFSLKRQQKRVGGMQLFLTY